MVVSIHTPTQGVTCFCHQTKATSACFNPHTHAGCDYDDIQSLVLKNVSIHTPTQGVTNAQCRSCNRFDVSIHTPTQGVTSGNLIIYPDRPVSIHTPTQGVTVDTIDIMVRTGFNPHTHAGCDCLFPQTNSVF